MKKVQIGYGVDVDAVSGWIGSYGGEDSISDISRGMQAGEVNVHRLLKMFKKYNMTQTFYIPGHSLDTFPKECVAIRDAGHEIGLHGYSHEEPNKLSAQQQEDVFNHTYELLTKFVGEPPKGIVTPMCQISEASAQLLVDKGMEYDHSAMHRDCVPYYLRVGDQWEKVDPSKPASSWMKPLVRGKLTDLVEVPMNWFQDDFIPLTFVQNMPHGGGWQDPDTLIKIWKERFEYFYREYDYFIFPMWYV
ncbi:hypothetical protein LTR84_004715 [Exophiala bonariae]|uniref:NodB homology domain-containing protein n=1 Tax=Exophiala bonariae TaxID=1690606 RepID=A0AAV9NQ73_9EURO|nr:hypothetical protein LTR84_004715 [Exophiala bonariae]